MNTINTHILLKKKYFSKKNIKVFILLILLGVFGFPNFSYSDDCSNSCKILDAPAPALTEYLTNIEVLRSNIISSLGEYESSNLNEPNDSIDTSKKTLISFNTMGSFNDYFGSFDYKISLPITNEVPDEITRDHKRLEDLSKTLSTIYENASRRGSLGHINKSICENISNCNFDNISIGEVLVRAITNNRNIIRLYESSILDKAYLAENRSFIFVSSDFEKQLLEYYNKDTLGLCSKCEGNSWLETSNQIKNIVEKNINYKAGVQKWIDAWNLLWGTNNKNNTTESVLDSYLRNSGLSGGQGDVLIDNINRYGTNGVSASNPVLNSSNYAGVSIDNTIDTLSQTLSQQFDGRQRVPIIELTEVNSEIKSTENLSLGIQSLFEEQLPYAQAQDIGSQQLQLRIIRMHASLVRSINELQKNKTLAEILCDKQGTGDGKCDGY